MATENRILDVSYEAAEDLSNDQFRFVVLTSSGTVRRPDSGAEVPYGVLQNAPGSGEAAVVRIDGISKLEANAALTIGTFVKPEYVGATDAGKGQDASGEIQCARGVVVEASSAEDDVCSIRLIGPAPQRFQLSIGLPDLLSSTTKYTGVLACGRDMLLTRASLMAYTPPGSATGVATLVLSKWDNGTSAAKTLVSSFNLKGLTALVSEDLDLTTTAADLTLEAGDSIYIACACGTTNLTTAMAGAVITLEGDLL